MGRTLTELHDDLSGVPDRLGRVSDQLKDLAFAFRSVGNDYVAKALMAIASQLAGECMGLRQWLNDFVTERVEAADQSSQAVVKAALGAAGSEGR